MEIKLIKIDRIMGEDKFKKPTTTLEITYESGGVPSVQKIVSFANPSVFKVLDASRVGDSFDVAVTKNAKGYDTWSSIGAVGTIKDTPVVNKVIGSNYETATERAVKQRYIVRQSSLANAIALSPKGSIKDIIAVAKEFEEYVFSPVEELV